MMDFGFAGRKRRREITFMISEVPELPQSDKEHILDFLEAGEWGLALDTLCSQIDENDLRISEGLYQRIQEVGSKMGMDVLQWDFLRRLIK